MSSYLCPYCGHRGGSPDQCEACRGMLEPLSRRATQIAMGPWFVRDARRPFNPGCCYTVLQKLVRSGKVKAGTPLRGPTTHQLWAPARLVPGVAHLAGFCHACGDATDPAADKCKACGEAFPSPVSNRDEMGLKDVDVAKEISSRRRLTHHMCPCCGHTPTLTNRCDICKTVFSPPIDATPVTLGPWFVRDNDAHFRHGMAYSEVRDLINRHQILPATVLRGPTTHQFYQRADETPGVAHLLGKCHACGKTVEPTDTLCLHCEEPFDSKFDDNHLGLIYTFQEDADAAQEQLNHEVEQFMASAAAIRPSVKPPPPPAGSSVPPPVPGSATPPPAPHDHTYDHAAHAHDDVPVAYSIDSGADHRDDAAAMLAAASGGEPVMHAVGVAATYDDPVIDYSDSYASPTSSAGALAGSQELIKRREESRLKTIGVVLVITVVLGFVTVIVLVAMSDGDGMDDPSKGTTVATTDPAVSYNDPGAFERVGMRRRNLAGELERVTALERAHGVGELVDKLKDLTQQGGDLFTSRNFARADQMYDQSDALIKQIDKLNDARKEANLARSDAQTAVRVAVTAGVDQNVKQVWDEGDNLAKQAQAHYDKGEFAEAVKLWKQAKTVLDGGREQALAFQRAAKARDEFVKAATALFTREQLDKLGGDAWKAVKAIEQAAEADIKAGKMTDAITKYEDAKSKVPDVNEVVKLEAGVNFYALGAGRVATLTLMDLAGGLKYTQDKYDAVIGAYSPLRLGGDFTSSIPSGGDASYQDVAQAIWIKGADLIEQQKGKPARASFNVGVKFVIIQKLLKKDVLTIEPATKGEILKQLESMKESAKDADYPKEMLDLLASFEEEVKATPDKDAVRQSRAIWQDLNNKLESYETGYPLVVKKD